jgi:hypothetical protein
VTRKEKFVVVVCSRCVCVESVVAVAVAVAVEVKRKVKFGVNRRSETAGSLKVMIQ